MRAWQITRLGQPEDALELVESPDRAPAAGEVAVRAWTVSTWATG